MESNSDNSNETSIYQTINIYVLRTLNVLSFIAVLLINQQQASGSMGNDVGTVSNSFKSWIIPASQAFSIWGLIYALNGIFVVVQCFPQLTSLDNQRKLQQEKISQLLIFASIANMGWIVVFTKNEYETAWLSLILIFLILIPLVIILERTKAHLELRDSIIDQISVDLFFSFYAGWLTLACILNTSMIIIKQGNDWDGGAIGRDGWSYIIIAIAFLINLIAIFVKNNYIYPLVFSWATFWIARAQSDYEERSTSNFQIQCYVLASVMLLIDVLYVIQLIQNNKFIFIKTHKIEIDTNTNAVNSNENNNVIINDTKNDNL